MSESMEKLKRNGIHVAAASALLIAGGVAKAQEGEAPVIEATAEPPTAEQDYSKATRIKTPENVIVSDKTNLPVSKDALSAIISSAVSFLGCSGTKIISAEGDLMGVATAEHCNMDTGTQIYHGTQRNGQRLGTVNNTLAYPDIDQEYGSFPPYTPQEVIDRVKEMRRNLDMTQIQPNTTIVTAGFPYRSPSGAPNSSIRVFESAALGYRPLDYFYSLREGGVIQFPQVASVNETDSNSLDGGFNFGKGVSGAGAYVIDREGFPVYAGIHHGSIDISSSALEGNTNLSNRASHTKYLREEYFPVRYGEEVGRVNPIIDPDSDILSGIGVSLPEE